MKKYYYERSNLLESEVNLNFEQVLYMDDISTTEWIDQLRTFILNEWDDKGIPPTIGQYTYDLKKNFRKLRDYPLHQGSKEFLKYDDSDNQDVIKNYNKHASGINQFFPTMLKTRVNNGSIYDWFTEEYKDKFQKVIRRIIKRDSMYNFSKCILIGDEIQGEWFVVQQKKVSNPEYLTLTSSEVKELDFKQRTNVTEYDDEKYSYFIRKFKLGQKIFPPGIQAFRLGLGQPAVNFPALTARYLYERYTEHIGSYSRSYVILKKNTLYWNRP